MDFEQLYEDYRRVLFEDILPFWTRHAIDPEGGINSCIEDDGRVINRDRWGWSQWRAVWVFAKIYNTLQKDTKWLDIAEGIARFLLKHGPLENGHWPLLLGGDGSLKRGYESLYTDGFAIYALVELWKAQKDDRLLDHAMRTFHAVEAALQAPDPPPAWPYPIEKGCLAHGISMIFSIVFHELGQAASNPAVSESALKHHARVMNIFLRPDRGLLLENLRSDGSELPPPKGTVVVPGHAIESMWFQMHVAGDLGDGATSGRAAEAVLRHLEAGWDEEYGGLFLAVDVGGGKEVAWDFADSKLWWPQTEALYATLLAYERTGKDCFLDWFRRIHEYSFSNFPLAEHGEWRQKLDRRGKPFKGVVALPVKDPFHLPRALIYCIEVLERLKDKPC